MRVNNIFELIKKFNNAEDQLSAAFGFLLAHYPKLRSAFLRKIGVSINREILRQVDIETQVEYPRQKSRIDLQLIAQDRWFILCESKIASAQAEILAEQLKKYVQIIKENKEYYQDGQRLVVILRYPIPNVEIKRLAGLLNCTEKFLKVLSWEDLINLAGIGPRTKLTRLFQEYLGDSMHNKRSMKERKVKDVEEVLVIFTNPIFWEMTEIKNIAVQSSGTTDAQYIAFLRTHLKKPFAHKSLITHVARVETTEFVARKTMLEGLPRKLQKRLREHSSERKGHDWKKMHKQYNLKPNSMVKLANPVIHNVPGIQVKFRTTFAELLKAKTTAEMDKGSGHR